MGGAGESGGGKMGTIIRKRKEERKDPSSSLLARLSPVPQFLGCLVGVCLPLSQFPGNYLFASLVSKPRLLLSPLSKMTLIPDFASLSLELSCSCEFPVYT